MTVKPEIRSAIRPLTWLGAPATGGLALPAAAPTASQLYAPRGVFLNDDYLVAADSGNHRVLIWRGLPRDNHQPADVVLGQQDFFSEGPNAAGRGPENGLHLPTGVWIVEDQLIVADAWNHRVLVWDGVPEHPDTPPSHAIGQASLSDQEPNSGCGPQGNSLYWPYGVSFLDGWFYVADTGNRRVLGWNGLPTPGQHADMILGQASASENRENREGPVSARSFRWPHAVAGDRLHLYVADAGNHRVLGWTPRTNEDVDANILLGQPDVHSNSELPYQPQGPQRLRFPYAIACEQNCLAVADTANNRVLLWTALPHTVANCPADVVIGQFDFDASGENRWDAVADDTLCWPYGVHLHQGLLAVADSGNNRVMIWDFRDLLRTDETPGAAAAGPLAVSVADRDAPQVA